MCEEIIKGLREDRISPIELIEMPREWDKPDD